MLLSELGQGLQRQAAFLTTSVESIGEPGAYVVKGIP